MYRQILIPTDGSELAHKGVVHGLSLAKAVGAKVIALTVEAFNPYDASESRMKEAREHAASILNEIAKEAKTAGVECETLQLIQHDPEVAIVATAKEKGCDLIVIASHGRSGIAAALLGSVTAKVLVHTAIPVLVCH
ncbi:MAG: universal stress protein [Bradyrhizobium sp.]|uniref:universal stress protein n=1 Tax=Bradyrhizobium sp. TaxID=376 RepID=UPI002393ECBA|nr:universal stress protein [Bradyrhizobium sp.]MDE2068989.1 universal stress protein [Bradyrhizobium sp.]MDE2242329.1 universal stress protein [Bradyrhizobium sp.]